MRYSEFIPEAKGLKYATPGEIYQSPDGTQYFFKKWHSDFPPGPKTQYSSPEETLKAAELAVGHNLPNKVFWVGGNNPTNRKKSFVFAEFESDTGESVRVGKFVTGKGPNNTIYDKEVRDIASLTKYNASGQKNVWAVKGDLGVKPGELGIATGNPISISNIKTIIKKHKNSEILSPAIDDAAAQKAIIFPGGALFRQA